MKPTQRSPRTRRNLGSLLSTVALAFSGCVAVADGAPRQDELASADPILEGDAGSGTDEAVESNAQELTVAADADEFPRVGDGYFGSQGRFAVSTTACLIASTYKNVDKAWADGSVKLDIGQKQVETDFSVSASAKASYGLFSGTARAEFMKRSRSDARSLTYVHRLRTVFGDELYDNRKPYTFGVSPTSSSFYSKCGDHYTRGVKRGGSLYIVVQLDFATEEERAAFEAAAKANYAGAGGETNTAWARSAFNGRLNVSVFAYQEGGAVQLLGNAFAGSRTENGVEVLDCALSNFDACRQFVAAASKYASTTFTSNLTWANAAAISYDVQPWTQFPEANISTRGVPSGVVDLREWLLTKIQKAADVENRIQALKRANYFGGPPSFQEQVADIEAQNKANIPIINAAVDVCFDGYKGGPFDGLACAMVASDEAFAEKGYKPISIAVLEPKLKATATLGGRAVIAQKTPVQPSDYDWQNKGEWKSWKMCPAGTFVIGYAMQVEPGQGSSDDSGVNGIRLRCDNWDRDAGSQITIWTGEEGTWNPQATCSHGAINGFRIKVEGSSATDDKGATDLLATCMSSESLHAPGGLASGQLDDNNEMCPAGTAVCGMKVLNDDFRGADYDDTAVNNISFACCAY